MKQKYIRRKAITSYSTPPMEGLREWMLSGRWITKTERVGDCLVWTGKNNGYPQASYTYQGIRYEFKVHRAMLAYSLGREPELDASHLCHNPLCIEPTHLIEESRSANNARNADDPTDWLGLMAKGDLAWL